MEFKGVPSKTILIATPDIVALGSTHQSTWLSIGNSEHTNKHGRWVRRMQIATDDWKPRQNTRSDRPTKGIWKRMSVRALGQHQEFRVYTKSKGQESTGVSPLKDKGGFPEKQQCYYC